MTHALLLDEKFVNISRAQICRGRIAISGTVYETQKKEIIIMDLGSQNILLKCSKLFDLQEVMHFSFHSDKIFFLEDIYFPEQFQKATVFCSKIWL